MELKSLKNLQSEVSTVFGSFGFSVFINVINKNKTNFISEDYRNRFTQPFVRPYSFLSKVSYQVGRERLELESTRRLLY